MAIVEESALGEHGPLGRTGTPFLRRYDDDAICCVGTVQGRCRRPLHDLDVLNRLRVDVADSTEIAPAVPERSRTVVRRHAYAIDDVDRIIIQAYAAHAAHPNPLAGACLTPALDHDTGYAGIQHVSDCANRLALDELRDVDVGNAVAQLRATLLTRCRRDDLLELDDG